MERSTFAFFPPPFLSQEEKDRRSAIPDCLGDQRDLSCHCMAAFDSIRMRLHSSRHFSFQILMEMNSMGRLPKQKTLLIDFFILFNESSEERTLSQCSWVLASDTQDPKPPWVTCLMQDLFYCRCICSVLFLVFPTPSLDVTWSVSNMVDSFTRVRCMQNNLRSDACDVKSKMHCSFKGYLTVLWVIWITKNLTQQKWSQCWVIREIAL